MLDLTTRRVLLVEDDPRLRSRLAAVLRRRPHLRVVGEVETAEEALALLKQGLEVDVALVDLRLPGMPGQELISIAKAAWPRVELLVLTGFADDDSIYEALRAGATGYLLKDAGVAEITAAIDGVCDGGAPMSPARRGPSHHLPVGASPITGTARDQRTDVTTSAVT